MVVADVSVGHQLLDAVQKKTNKKRQFYILLLFFNNKMIKILSHFKFWEMTQHNVYLSRAEQTIFAVLLWHASSKGRKKVSTWTHDGFGSGRTDDDLGDLSPVNMKFNF